MHFRFYADEIESETDKEDFSNKVIILNATSVLIFQYQKKYQENDIIQLVYKDKSAKEIADKFSLKIRTVDNIFRAE